MRLHIDNDLISLWIGNMAYSDGSYSYVVEGRVEGQGAFADKGIRNIERSGNENLLTITGSFACGLKLRQVFHIKERCIDEEITFTNESSRAISTDNIGLGFMADMESRRAWRLCAIPFRVQLDGRTHDYPVKTLIEGEFRSFVNGSKEFRNGAYYGNSVYSDPTRKEPELTEEGILRSEAWAWGDEKRGMVIIKYNNDEIEYSIACPQKDESGAVLRFGGAGLCLYGEPVGAGSLQPGQSYTFGKTSYIPYNDGINEAFYIYRNFLDEKGHHIPEEYNPPVNWNELYDIGWYHSDPQKLKAFYTKEALLNEAEKAKQCGCDLLYLDPGWEVAEGTTVWNWTRLGSVRELVDTLKSEYGLELGYRTILHSYTNYWPQKYLLRRSRDFEPTGDLFVNGQFSWPLCMCCDEFLKEKLRRIIEISKEGVKFMMFDEMDWRGACIDEGHGHEIPTKVVDHVNAVYRLAAEVRNQCPGILLEVHDPVWPWHTCTYVPSYFSQGFGKTGCYHENWGFEYMWNCLNDLKSGKALALYYYNMGCNIPLYLHITMAADNDNCLFLWWAASTVRHLGIGGKDSHPTVEEHALPPYDHEKRFACYCKQMKIYKALKPYFSTGRFIGINEHVHLHILPGVTGGVINVFNIEDTDKEIAFKISYEWIGCDKEMTITWGDACWGETSVEIRVKIPAMSPVLVCLGEAAVLWKGAR